MRGLELESESESEPESEPGWPQGCGLAGIVGTVIAAAPEGCPLPFELQCLMRRPRDPFSPAATGRGHRVRRRRRAI